MPPRRGVKERERLFFSVLSRAEFAVERPRKFMRLVSIETREDPTHTLGGSVFGEQVTRLATQPLGARFAPVVLFGLRRGDDVARIAPA